MSRLRLLSLAALTLSLLILSTPGARASVSTTGDIKAKIDHPFMIGNTTLPPGHYNFRMLPGSDQKAMVATSANDATSVEFLVRPSASKESPVAHTQLIFSRYGKVEILKDIYVAGSRTGAAVLEASRMEGRMQKQGQKPETHTEKQLP